MTICCISVFNASMYFIFNKNLNGVQLFISLRIYCSSNYILNESVTGIQLLSGLQMTVGHIFS